MNDLNLPVTMRFSHRVGSTVLLSIICMLFVSCGTYEGSSSEASVTSASGSKSYSVAFGNERDLDPFERSITLPNIQTATAQSLVVQDSNIAPTLAAAVGGSGPSEPTVQSVQSGTQEPVVVTAITLPTLTITGKSPDANNFISLTEPFGIERKNYPLQVGRVFMQGQFPSSVQLRINSTSIPTQVDVKNRWPDGSIKFAILSALIPSIAPSAKMKIDFEAIIKGSEPVGPTLDVMLNDNPQIDASIEISSLGKTSAVMLRQMLRSAPQQFWISGPISSTLIVADHSVNRAFDIAGTSMKSIRPMFHITFWHGLKIAKVRFVAEGANTQAFEDATYDLVLKTGPTDKQSIVYQQKAVPQIAGSRWTKSFWIGTKFEAISLAANVSYLAKTRVIPNFDPNLPVPEAQIAKLYAQWNAGSQGLYGTGLWNKYMPAPGGRDEIAIFPNWAIDALISGDYRMNEMSERNAELAAAWPMHFREGAQGKFFDSAKTKPALGSPISLNGRPSLNISIGNAFFRGTYIKTEDQLSFGVAATDNGWVPDGSHQPAPYILPYMQTGDYFYLEQMQFWASWGAYLASVDLSSGFYGRGPKLTSGQLSGDIRSQAWILRNRAAAAYFSPDASKEKDYFSGLVMDAIEIAEGIRGVTGSAWQGNESWKWGASVGRLGFYGPYGVHPLKMWDNGNTGFAIAYHNIDPAVVQRGFAPFQMGYLLVALDHVRGLGFPTDKLITWSSGFITEATKNQATANLIGVFAIPAVATSPNANYSTWASIASTYADPNYAQKFTEPWLNSVDGMPLIMTAATATIINEPGGAASYDWVKSNWASKRTTAIPARWAILPR